MNKINVKIFILKALKNIFMLQLSNKILLHKCPKKSGKFCLIIMYLY